MAFFYVPTPTMTSVFKVISERPAILTSDAVRSMAKKQLLPISTS
jgi:hypothetical protein